MEQDSSDYNLVGIKVTAMVVLGVGSFLFGMVPALVAKEKRQRHPLTVSMLLCFGAGVLLAIAIVHMLAEVKEEMPEHAELVFCIGYFIIYIVDELVYYYFGESIQHNHENTLEQTGELENINARICHTSHIAPCERNWISILGLLCALSVHSFLEGLAIGVQDTVNLVLLLLLAVSAHKYVVAFCLGIELCANTKHGFRTHAISILVFALGSVLGIALGMCLVDIQESLSNLTIPIVEALASGTLLYVTVSEILPREKARWHKICTSREAGIKQLFSVIIGFTMITLLNTYLNE